MPIESSGEIRLRGTAGDNRTDINEEINGNATDTDVSLGTLNTSAFTNVADGTTISGRSMSEMRGYAAFTSAFPSTEADGALDKSLYFNASGEIVYLDRNADFTNTHTTSTFSFWLKLNDIVDGTKTIFSTGNSQTDRVWFQLSSATGGANDNRPYILASVGGSNVIQLAYDYIINDASSWYHFVIAVDTTKDYQYDRVRTYINGIELKDLASSRTPIYPSKNQVIYFNNNQRIGDTYWASGYGNDMTIADFKFIDGKQLRPDSFGELVQGIWIPKAFNTPSTDTLVTSNLIAKYELNGNANDTSGSATTYNGTASNVSFLNNNYGILEIEGGSDKVDFSTIPSSVFNNATVSVSTWVNMKALATVSAAGSFVFIGKGDWQIQVNSSSSYGFMFTKYHGSSGGNNGTNNASFYPSGGPQLNRWYHIVAVDDTPNGNGIKLYLDGELVAENTAYTNIDDNGWVAGIANYPGRTGGNFRVGETQIYTKALTPAEVKQNYNATKHKYTYGLNGFWLPLNNTSTGSIDSSSNLKLHLDASNSSSYTGSGTTWSDLTSNGNNGTISGASFLSSTNGGVFSFDGSNDKVDLNSLQSFFGQKQTFTVELWFNAPSSSTGNRALFDDYNYSNQNIALYLYNGVLNYFGRYNNNDITGVNSGSVTYNDNKWHHVIVTSDQSTVKLYADGKFINSGNVPSSSYSGGTPSVGIGRQTHPGSSTYSYFEGKIAQVRVYDKALTAQEIITNYRATQGNYEQVSTVDISGNANSFTATNIDYTDHIPDEPLNNKVTFDPNNLWGTGSPTLSDGNKVYKSSLTAEGFVTTTMSLPRNSGKYYFEFKSLAGTGHGFLGITDSTKFAPNNAISANPWDENEGFAVLTRIDNYADIYKNGVAIQADAFPLALSGGVLALAIDTDNDKYWAGYASGGSTTWWNSGNPAAGTNESSSGLDYAHYMPFVANVSNGSGRYQNAQLLCDDNEIVGTVPTDFKLLSFNNLPAPAFDPDGTTPDKPSNYFKAVTYQGNGGTQGEAYGYKEGSRAVVFNGANGSKITTPITNTQLPVSSAFSISAWMNFKSSSSGTSPIGMTDTSSPYNGWAFYVVSGTLNIAWNGAAPGFTTGSEYTITNGEWFHVVLTYNGSGTWILYINGNLQGTKTSTTVSTPSANLIFGDGDVWGTMDGKLDEVRIYNKTLNSTEVGYLADDDTSNINAISNLIAYYDMEGDANDESGSATTYNGTPSNVTFTQDKPYGNIDVGFAPDFVWVRDRFSIYSHCLTDSVRGPSSVLFSDGTFAQDNSGIYFSSFDSNGFSIKAANAVNKNSDNYIAWAWKAGGAAVSNTDGSDTTSVSANQDAGFSIVSLSKTDTNTRTYGHGLSSAPEMIILKRTASADDWYVYHKDLGNTVRLSLNSDAARVTGTGVWGSTTPTDIVFTLQNQLGGAHIAYCFHSVDGFSKIGSYTGNGSSDGPFVYTGFKPAWIMVKNATSAGNEWNILDNSRDTNNPNTKSLWANDSATETTASQSGIYSVDFLSNGFKIKNLYYPFNGSGQTIIYMAFAEDPVKYSNGVATLGDGNEFIQGDNYPEDNFTTTTYTGNGGTQSISSLNYQPDLVWIKCRNVGYSNHIQDVIRGAGSLKDISSDGAWAEGTYNYGSVDFDTNGFTVGSGGHPTYGRAQVNESGRTYVAWSWKAAGNANTYNILENGTVTSSASASTLGLDTGTITPIKVSANRDNGFSIMNFTGTSTAGDTVPHGLSKPPEFVIAKQYSGSSEDWFTWHKDYGISGGEYQWLRLNDGTNIPAIFNNEAVWNNVAPSSTLFTLNGGGSPNRSGDKHIYYSWHSVPGYSKIGKYTGKGSTAAFNVYLGFEPAWILIRRIDSGNYWSIFDNKRDQDGQMNLILYPNRSDIESNGQTTTSVTVDSDGFSFTTSQYGGSINTNGGEYIYMAFAHR